MIDEWDLITNQGEKVVDSSTLQALTQHLKEACEQVQSRSSKSEVDQGSSVFKPGC